MIESMALKLSEAEIGKSPLSEIAKSIENKNMNVSELDKPIAKDIVSLDDNGNIYKKNSELVPNNEYVIDKITYKTDSNRNIELFLGEISRYTPEAERDTVAQLEVGGEARKIGDDGGHLIARMFGGAPGNENLVPMRDTINRGDYKKLENEIKEAVQNGDKVNISGEIKREENNSRPSEIKVNISYNDRNSEFIFDNNKGSLKLEAELEKQGKNYQSNNMVEENLIDSLKIEKFYENIAKIIRSDKEFREEKMNIVKVNREKKFSIEIDEKNCKVYKIKKEWKNEVYNV